MCFQDVISHVGGRVRLCTRFTFETSEQFCMKFSVWNLSKSNLANVI